MVSCDIYSVTDGWPRIMLFYDEESGKKWVPFQHMCSHLIEEKMFLRFMGKNREEKRNPEKWTTIRALNLSSDAIDNVMEQFEPELRSPDMHVVELDEFFHILDQYGEAWFRDMDEERYALGKRIVLETAACITATPDEKQGLAERLDHMTEVLQNFVDDSIREEAIRRYCSTNAFKRDREQLLQEEVQKELEKIKNAKE